MFVGVDSNPTEDTGYTNLDYAVHVSSDGNLYAAESSYGVAIGTIATGDFLELVYTGTKIIYYQNGISLREVTVSVTGMLYMDSSFYTSDTSISNVQFGPYASNDSAIYTTGTTTIDGGNLTTDTVTASALAANTITASEMAANSVEAGNINVSYLSAIQALLGSVTLDTSGKINTSGKTTFSSATAGIFQGWDTTQGAYCLNVGNGTNYLSWDGSAVWYTGKMGGATAGDYAEAEIDDTVSATSYLTPVKIAEFILGRSGTYRIKMDVGTTLAYQSWAQIYKNGVAYGTLRGFGQGNNIYSEDLSFTANDLVQLYVWSNNSIAVYAYSFSACTSNMIMTRENEV